MFLAVIFDFGNVLGTVDKMRSCKKLAMYSPLPADRVYKRLVGSDLERSLESGQISTDQFCRTLRQEIQADLPPDEIKKIWGDAFSANTVAEHVVSILAGKGIRLAVLSNTNGIHWPYIQALPVMKFLQTCNAPTILSYEIKSLKPDPRMYETALDRLQVSASHALYLDDVFEYVCAARGIGMAAEIYDCSKDPEYIVDILCSHSLPVS